MECSLFFISYGPGDGCWISIERIPALIKDTKTMIKTLGRSLPGKLSTFRSISTEAPAWSTFASVDPWSLSSTKQHTVKNLLNGKWVTSKSTITLPDPLNGKPFMFVADSQKDDVEQFSKSINTCTKSGLHNPLKNPQRYLQLGDISAKAAAKMRDPLVLDYFATLIQRVAPKSKVQAVAEVSVTQKFIENFGGDQVRFLARSFSIPGDHMGQMSTGYRWPYGPVVVITPFNFPLEIPMLQLLGALYMGNKVLLKVDSKVAVVMEQALRLLHDCGLPMDDVDYINCNGEVMNELLLHSQPRMTLFTGSSVVAEKLARDLRGRIKLEDAGWDWKILGPDVSDIDFVAYTSDQDAYAYSGQKCSAQSALFVHENWSKVGFVDKIKHLAERRNLKDLTVGPVLTVTNERFLAHVSALLAIPGASLAFGGDLLSDHQIPQCYGSWKPTAVKIPIEQLLSDKYFDLCTTEIFGGFQIIVDYKDDQLDLVLAALERVHAHLTAAVVSNDVIFQNKVLGSTVNGTTYCGIRARTTGAPQNHWFGPAGDPRGAGIGTPEAIKLVWSCHREVITDEGPIPSNWTLPACS